MITPTKTVKKAGSETGAEARLKLVTVTNRRPQVPKIAIVIPCYNEEENIIPVLDEIRALRVARPRWEIIPIIVNDGSTDRTDWVLNKIAPEYSAHVITLPLNLGIGRAVQSGFKYAVRIGADVSLQLDGDGQHPTHEIPLIVCPILAGQSDVVVGSRYAKGAGGNVSSSLRQAGTWFFSRLLKTLVNVEITDATSGFRAFSSEATDFLARYYPDDYPEVEAYVPLARREFRINEVPVHMRVRAHGTSSITPFKSVYYMVKVAFATILDVIRPLPKRRSFQ